MSIVAGIGIALVAGFVGNRIGFIEGKVKGRFDMVDQLLDGTATCSDGEVTFCVK